MNAMNLRASFRTAVLGAALVAAAAPALAGGQWTVHYLPLPADIDDAELNSMADGIPAGTVFRSGYRACVWRSISREPEILVDFSYVYGSGAGRFVGLLETEKFFLAHIFGGLTGPISLHPDGADSSAAFGTDGVIQVGEVDGDAALWRGTADSYVNLAPPGSSSSEAVGTDGGVQVGFARIEVPGEGIVRYASLWQGTPASWRSLHPVGVDGSSSAYAIHQGTQVGEVNGRAALWRGTPESWVNLVPGSSESSSALGVFGGYQVGAVGSRAAFWRGTAASFEDLSVGLPPTAQGAAATCIWVDNTTIYVGGFFFDESDRQRPIVWTRPICRADFNDDGMIDIDDFWVYLAEYAAGCE